ncbi:MAG: site-specific DNA-methyltransferase [Patescibacteria group bacterium]|nr:site-specific DNA-methyltransferase [Patescibacteria group bacterium]MCL5409870.1 site-specific DNA-methyltransferase [Patescibacteria group bacterium]
MPVLNWIGKDAVANHDKKVPFRLLKKIESASVGDNSQNLIIHGDNLEALKALMPFYYGKIKCIYIDPPYNTGNESWVYNDKVNSPKIRQWLGKVVGRESEDLTRHDKWLCMMYPRLKLLRDLLAEDGAIFVSIDDNEHCNLKQIMDEIFGAMNFISNIIWQKKYTQSNDAKYFSNTHDFIVCYAKNKLNSAFKIRQLERTAEQNARYKNPDGDPRGAWKAIPLHAKSGNSRREVIFKNGIRWTPPPGTFNRYSDETIKESDADNRIYFGSNGAKTPVMKLFLSNVGNVIPKTIWMYDEVGSNDEARRELKEIFPENVFDTPKPVNLIKRIINLASNSDDIILDSFAGSGTTGHAVLNQNKIDGGNRKFILIELEDKVAKDITAERVKRVTQRDGYKGGFEYCELDKPLFNDEGQIEEECSFNQFATYIYFTETQTNIDSTKINGNYIGESEDTIYYLIYKDKGKNDLNKAFLKNLKRDGKKVIYADRCLLDEDLLAEYNIVFKQIPYEVKVY